MKKLIVLSVIFALVAGSVFAADVSVTVFGTANLFEGSNAEKLDVPSSGDKPVYTTREYVGTGYSIGRIRIDANGALEDGTIGAYLRFEGSHDGTSPSGVQAWGYVWYKPADILKITFGSNGYDGFFGLDGVARWNYYQLGSDVGFISESWKFGASFFGGWGGDNKGGLILTSKPIDALEINIGFPIGGISDAYKKETSDPGYTAIDPAYKKYQQFTIQAKYNIDGVGTAGLTYKNSLFNYSADDPKLWAYFGLSSIENLGIDVGIGYKFPDVTTTDTVTGTGSSKSGVESTKTTNYPLALGVAANFSSGALGVKARVQAEFLGSVKTDNTIYTMGDSKSKTDTNDPYGLNMVIDVQPSFAINETMTAYVSTGVYFKTGEDKQVDTDSDGNAVYEKEKRSLVGWHIQPYVVITPSYWSGAFFAGIRLESPQPSPFDGDTSSIYWNGDKGDQRNRILYWSIPIGISFSY